MATESVDGISAHMRGLTVTTITAVAGIGAAFVSNAVASGATDRIALVAVLGAILVQLPLLRGIGILDDDFSGKDYLYISFMTFALWFVSWGVLLTTGA
jgi:hypothetical protein